MAGFDDDEAADDGVSVFACFCIASGGASYVLLLRSPLHVLDALETWGAVDHLDHLQAAGQVEYFTLSSCTSALNDL